MGNKEIYDTVQRELRDYSDLVLDTFIKCLIDFADIKDGSPGASVNHKYTLGEIVMIKDVFMAKHREGLKK